MITKPKFKRLHPELYGDELDREWKKFQKQQTFQLYNAYHKLTQPEPLDNITGFRSKDKNEYLNIKPNHRELIPEGFKINKKYICHLDYPNGTYFMDIMFSGDFNYLLLLDFHTRFLYIEPVKNKTPQEVFLSLSNILENNNLQNKVKVIRGDGEKAFVSHQFHTWLKNRGITFKSVKKEEIYPGFKQLNHAKLGVIDRVTRTLRDQAYVAGYGDPLPINLLRHLVNVYNRAPHKFLSKYYGKPISPSEVDEEKKLKIWKRVRQYNFNVTKQSGYKIKPGRKIQN